MKVGKDIQNKVLYDCIIQNIFSMGAACLREQINEMCCRLAHLVVVQRVVHRDVPLPGDGHRHEDGARDCHLVERVEQVWEQHDVQVRSHAEVLPVVVDDVGIMKVRQRA